MTAANVKAQAEAVGNPSWKFKAPPLNPAEFFCLIDQSKSKNARPPKVDKKSPLLAENQSIRARPPQLRRHPNLIQTEGFVISPTGRFQTTVITGDDSLKAPHPLEGLLTFRAIVSPLSLESPGWEG